MALAEYQPKDIEQKWQRYWAEHQTFATPLDPGSRKAYVLDMFPYPSGDGLHVGHVKIYTGSDVFARYMRHRGQAVLHPMGWDAFGLPTENSAIKFGVHPAKLTKRNTTHFREQMQMMGFSYDWEREINTTDPTYYRWTQWIFLQLFKRGLAYRKKVEVNWCPQDKTGLANEEVVDGCCERCGTPVERKPLNQWMLKITAYADRLLSGLPELDWPKFILEMQRNWIGRSEGVNFKIKVKDLNIEFQVYDSIPQTFMAQTFTMIAPDHSQLPEIVSGTEPEQAVLEFAERIKQKKLAGKFDIAADVEGIFTGRYIADPFGTGDLPLWVSSFVLADYGTGVVNASAHDERDFAFAKKYDIPLRTVMAPEDTTAAARVRSLEYCYTKDPDGVLEQPAEFAGRRWGEAREDIIEYIVTKGLGERAINYKLRDWVFSRQRYWGEPIPIIHCEHCGAVPVPEDQLPVTLPEVEKYEPTGTGESPLAAMTNWVNVVCPQCGGAGKRETDTMPQWAGSSWYWLRYIDPNNQTALADPALLQTWMPVNTYVGGAEHAVLHLLYGRFWQMVLFDAGIVPMAEPFKALRNVGLVMGADGQKMSKSRGNVINPDDEVAQWGADTVRIFAMFMGPFDGTGAWTTNGMAGANRFIKRVWELFQRAIASSGQADSPQIQLAVQRTITRVTESIDGFHFNTAVSSLMELLNTVSDQSDVSRATLETFAVLLSPLAPHVAEELWQQLGHTESITYHPWPTVDESVLARAHVTIPVQVNGRVRGTIQVAPGLDQAALTAVAEQLPNVVTHLAAKTIVKIIHVPDRLLNFVVK